MRVKIARGKYRGSMATVAGTDALGRYILRVDGVFAPVFIRPSATKDAK
jgi:hypothetical protein